MAGTSVKELGKNEFSNGKSSIVEPTESHESFADIDFAAYAFRVGDKNRISLVVELDQNIAVPSVGGTEITTSTPVESAPNKQTTRKIVQDNNHDVKLIKEVKSRLQLYSKKGKISQANANILWQDICCSLGGKYSIVDAKAKCKYLNSSYFRRKKNNAVCWHSQYLSFLDLHESDLEEELNTVGNADCESTGELKTPATQSSIISIPCGRKEIMPSENCTPKINQRKRRLNNSKFLVKVVFYIPSFVIVNTCFYLYKYGSC
ncbi:uncharacterized protein LOC117181263 [Belonocnema kinseyi]|uniref:uncharacterized protein LOC117181263 n=1 Tax=Belonocnema kinseyi TaxID=2817044 RepID=UPI00143DC3CC|nr:uncharacterized protein LOC117181263 [Belonocnema kinseyi]